LKKIKHCDVISESFMLNRD